MNTPIQYAYEATLPNGRKVRHLGVIELGAALAQRVNLEWKVSWHTSRKSASAHAKRFIAKMAESHLPTDRYEVAVLSVTQIAVPVVRWVAARLPNGGKRRTSYIPEWGDVAPVAAIFIADRGGAWITEQWATSQEAIDREVKRLKATHDQVKVCDAWIEGEYARA